MNVVLLSIIIVIGCLLLFLSIGFFILSIIRSYDKLSNISIALGFLLICGIYTYSMLVYLGKISDPIEQGVFKEHVSKTKENFDYSVPILNIKNPTDRELYEQEVNRLND